MPITAPAEAPRPGHDWHGLPPGRRAAKARAQAIARRRQHARALDAQLGVTSPHRDVTHAPEAERRELANALARAGFDTGYLAHRYGLTLRTTRADTRPGHDSGHPGGHQPGQIRGGQRQLSAPDTRTGRPGKGAASAQTDRESIRQEGTR